MKPQQENSSNVEQEAGSHGKGQDRRRQPRTGAVFPSTTEAGSAPRLWGFTPASTQAETLLFPSLLGRADAGLAGERYIRCIWYHSPQVSGLIRYSGPGGNVYLRQPAEHAHKSHPAFLKTWAGGWHQKTGPQRHSRTHKLTTKLGCRALPNSAGTLLPDRTRPLRKV